MQIQHVCAALSGFVSNCLEHYCSWSSAKRSLLYLYSFTSLRYFLCLDLVRWISGYIVKCAIETYVPLQLQPSTKHGLGKPWYRRCSVNGESWVISNEMYSGVLYSFPNEHTIFFQGNSRVYCSVLSICFAFGYVCRLSLTAFFLDSRLFMMNMFQHNHCSSFMSH